MDKEKLIQIYEVVADITLEHLNKIKEAETTLDDSDISMIRASANLPAETTDTSLWLRMTFILARLTP